MSYKYVIYIEDKPMFKGKNLNKLLEKAKAKYPNKKLSIGQQQPKEVLVV